MAPQISIPVGSWVLVTGATGFVGSHVTKQLLERGFRVRGTVRDVNQASWLVNHAFKAYAGSGFFELRAVPDLGAEGAFEEAMEGISAVAHVATITSFDADPELVIPPTIAGTLSILKAAMKEPSVKNIVFTSSIVAATLLSPGISTRVGRDTWNEFAVKAAWAPPPYEAHHNHLTYAASKVSSEKEVWKFVEENSPHFAVNVINPSAIIGEPLHEKHTQGPAIWVAMAYKNDKKSLDSMPAGKFKMPNLLSKKI